MLDSLPLELATEIFIFTLDSDISDDRLISQFDASYLCEDGHAWRRVALSTPQLWSNLTLCETHATNPNPALIEQWLGRAHLVSLSVWANSFPDTILDLIWRNNTKWKVLTFQCLGGPAFELSRINPAGGFPSLRELVINKSDQNIVYDHVIHGFHNAPRLQEFHVLGCSNFLMAIHIPWAQITRYSCSIPSDSIPTHFGVNPKSPGNMIPPLLHLKSLTLDSDTCTPTTILRYLTLPALQTLDIGFMAIQQLETLFTFLTRSSCQLVSFSAGSRETLLEPLIPCLEAMPTLSSLGLAISTSEEDGSHLLERLRGDLSLLPRLWDLTIVSNGRLLFPYDLLLETIRARTALVPLRRFALLWTSHPGRFYLPDAPLERQLRETGVDIHFGPHGDISS
ncbi:hypothetical protein C8F04DRAFT_1397814 [Mycena alexandri]|uniref:F-box domain-containing protein n=1 Tax=Mycena alexandri TaxID=1745969 RepID=A0AAD6SMM1_9AGAR|nr:hypothetical protein C8F04DRAFT_1397814 [Mycena alexandri]